MLNEASDKEKFKQLIQNSSANQSLLWPQLGHAGAMAHQPISFPKGPSEINIPDLYCEALTLSEVKELPNIFAKSAALAKELGFGGVQIHSAHGFLLSQFLSPLFNQRTDQYGGSILDRSRLLLEVIEAVRTAVGKDFPIALKLNATDQLEGGLQAEDSLRVVEELDKTSIDLLDISGGTYFPGAKSASDSVSKGAYFIDFAKEALNKTNKPLMLTGGFKTFEQASKAVAEGFTDIVGIARALALQPTLVNDWQKVPAKDPIYPRFNAPPEGGITAWYTMRLTDLAEDKETDNNLDLKQTISDYESRDAKKSEIWNKHFFTD